MVEPETGVSSDVLMSVRTARLSTRGPYSGPYLGIRSSASRAFVGGRWDSNVIADEAELDHAKLVG
jgi:hypothetical protein